MSLFKKNPNEALYHEGKKHFVDVIKNTGAGELLLWRQPEEDFNTNSTLIVMPGEKAIFINGGKIEKVFDSGTYKLSTKNYPFISRLATMFSGGISAFNCVVYFVRTAHSMEIRWGTDSPIMVRDKVLGISTKLLCRGSYKVAIETPELFLEKLVGNNVACQLQEHLENYFVLEFQSKIKSIIARTLEQWDTELLGIDAHLDAISDMIYPHIQEILSSYGLNCVKFVVSAIDIDENTLRTQYDQLNMDTIAAIKQAQGEKAAMDILGDDWAKPQAAKILKDLANNPEAGSIGSKGAGIGMGMASAGVFANMSQQMFAPMANSMQTPAPQQQAGRFTQKSILPQNTEPSFDEEMEKLAKLKNLYDAGLIELTEYEEKKKQLMDKI